MLETARNFDEFWKIVEKDFFNHPVIVNNLYTKNFKSGPTPPQFVDLIEQFSVFSNHFLPIQCERMVNAATETGERGARAILANEIGVFLNVEKGDTEGGEFRHANAHINWLRSVGKMLEIKPEKLGKWELGTPSTHKFLEELRASYASKDGNVGAGASFAIETWAAWGIGKGAEAEANNFWKELIEGINVYNKTYRNPFDLPQITASFFQYHFDIESGHGANVMNELRETFNNPEFDQEKWLTGGKKALNAIHTFWLGLEETRKKLEGGIFKSPPIAPSKDGCCNPAKKTCCDE